MSLKVLSHNDYNPVVCTKCAHLSTSYEEHKARYGSDAVQARHIRKVIKVVSDVVLEESHACHLAPRLQHTSRVIASSIHAA